MDWKEGRKDLKLHARSLEERSGADHSTHCVHRMHAGRIAASQQQAGGYLQSEAFLTTQTWKDIAR